MNAANATPGPAPYSEMGYGITTRLAHIDNIGIGPSGAGEIDWAAIEAWKGSQPTFVGRYFASTPTVQEIADKVGFCQWAHGEGNEPVAPKAFVPLQRADPARLERDGIVGALMAADDAIAVANAVERCLDVGDLALPTRTFVHVFLEVPDGSVPTLDYWSTWATTISGALINVAPGGLLRALRPAIACSFTQADPASPFLPAPSIQTILTEKPLAGRSNECFGLWSTTPLTNPQFGEFHQDPTDLDSEPIPILFWRAFDGPGGSELPAGLSPEQRGTLPLVAVDEHHDGLDDPTVFALVDHLWDPRAPSPPDVTTPPNNPPNQFGLDTAYRKTPRTRDDERRTIATCYSTKEMIIRRLPASVDGWGAGRGEEGTRFDPPNELRGRPSFVGRYLAPHFNGLSAREVNDLYALGIGVLSIWQLSSGRTMIGGRSDGKRAFEAAEALGQPPHTPIYFSVDISVGEKPEDNPASPSLDQTIDYFHDVRLGYADYLAAGGSTPYLVGAYAAANVLDALYVAGLATHFYQPWPMNWGPPPVEPPGWDDVAPGWRAWRRLNVWQVLFLENGVEELVNDNLEIRGCTEHLDLNVAWGDPGAWEPQ